MQYNSPSQRADEQVVKYSLSALSFSRNLIVFPILQKIFENIFGKH